MNTIVRVDGKRVRAIGAPGSLERIKSKYGIWTRAIKDKNSIKPWMAIQVLNDDNPLDLLAIHPTKAGTEFEETEEAAVFRIIEKIDNKQNK